MKTKALLVFDFDGTLVQSHENLFEAIQYTCAKMKIRCPSVEELQNKESLPLLNSLGMGLWGMLRFVRLCKGFLREKATPPIVEGIKEMIQEIPLERYQVGVLSAHFPDRIRELLERELIFSSFSFIEGDIPLWAKEKKLNQLFSQFKPSKALYVGDEERDIIASQKSGFQSIAVGWGVKTPALLQAYNPTYFISRPLHLGALLKSL